MFGMLLWAYRLDADLSGSYAPSQVAMARFHAQFWSMFFAAAKFGLAGCLGLSATLTSGTVLKVGALTLGGAFASLIFDFLSTGPHDWSGATGFTITFVLLCAGLALLAIGSVRVGWQRLQRAAV